jgi:hypothetical protein
VIDCPVDFSENLNLSHRLDSLPEHSIAITPAARVQEPL